MTVTASDPREASQLEVFQPPAVRELSVDHLFAGAPRYIVQGPPVRNDYKKKSGSSDGAKTYDTTAT
ncbi:hypothetical protein [Actinomadura miaoliensis]